MVKNAVPCLGALLAAHNTADWPAAVRPFNLLIRCGQSGAWSGGCPALLEPAAAASASFRRRVAPSPRPTPCSLSLDQRAKVRRTAQAAVGEVLAGLQAAPAAALAQASDGVLKLCQRVLPGPEAAAHAAAAAPSKKRQAAEEAIAAAVADALHLLGALKQWLPLLAGAWAGHEGRHWAACIHWPACLHTCTAPRPRSLPLPREKRGRVQ